VVILKLKQAEVALADGRLDEAYDLVRQPGLREHRGGQALVTRLAAALVDRGRVHLGGGHAAQALADCEKAEKLAGNAPPVAELRSAAVEVVLERQKAERRNGHLVAAARAHIENGRLSTGEHLLAGAADESRVAALKRDVAARREALDAAIARAQAALAADDPAAAAARLAEARQADGGDARFAELAARVAKDLRRRAAAAIDEGRTDAAESLLRPLRSVDPDGVETERLARAVEQLTGAWSDVAAGRPRDAAEAVRRVATLFPEAPWTKDVLRWLGQADEALSAVRGGPLGLLAGGQPWGRGDAPTQPPPPVPTPHQYAHPRAPTVVVPPPADVARFAMHRPHERPSPAGESGSLPSRFIIRVDGAAGSVLVFRDPLVTIGPVSSSRAPDLGLIAEPGLPVATVERVEDDYFLRAPVAAALGGGGGEAGGSRLLAAGDRITLSPRCRLTFALPNRASTSAVLDLTGARHPRADVRRVVLLDRDLVIGPGAAAHVRADHAAEPLVLHVRGGRLCCETKPGSAVAVDGRPMDRHVGIPMNAHVQASGISFVITSA
jgi:hypothetical protein